MSKPQLYVNGNKLEEITPVSIKFASSSNPKIMFNPSSGSIKINGKIAPELNKWAQQMRIQYYMEYTKQRNIRVGFMQGVADYRNGRGIK
jgi:hypothetical protein